ncbi:MAG TPA: hypothetical protein VEY95_10955 [Azospirillaceae bacterium]|nr:hypothetical protein [Azospirillaceae bacterium]
MISSRMHGVVDYLYAGAAPVGARRVGAPPGVVRAMDAVAAGSAVYALTTDYELGLVPVLSMRQHLMVDAALGVGLLTAAMRVDAPPRVRTLLAGMGAFALVAAALTDRESGTERRTAVSRRNQARVASARLAKAGAFLDHRNVPADTVGSLGGA